MVSDSSGGGIEGSLLASLASSLMPLMNCLRCPDAEGFMLKSTPHNDETPHDAYTSNVTQL